MLTDLEVKALRLYCKEKHEAAITAYYAGKHVTAAITAINALDMIRVLNCRMYPERPENQKALGEQGDGTLRVERVGA